MGSPLTQVTVAPSIQQFTALQCLSLQIAGGITTACVAALSSLQQLATLVTQLRVPNNAQEPLDLAEFAPLTGALSFLPHTTFFNRALHCLGCTWLSHSEVCFCCAGLEHLEITLVGGRADVLLSRKWAALERLTFLDLARVQELRQEAGPLDGPLHSLFQHLRRVNLQVTHGHVQPQQLGAVCLPHGALDLLFQGNNSGGFAGLRRH